MNNDVFDIIIAFVKAEKKDKPIESDFEKGKRYIHGTRYLLNQILRQYYVPKERRLVSKEAQKLWESIMGSEEDINDYRYHNIITAKLSGATISEYKGAKKNPEKSRELHKGEKFVFKDVFHVEHIVPIAVIIKELEKLYDSNLLDYKHVDEVLKHMYVCRMLKEEDRNIKEKFDRSFDKDEVIEKVYHPCGIYLVGED